MKWENITQDIGLTEVEEIWWLRDCYEVYRYLYAYCKEGVCQYSLSTREGVRALREETYKAYLDDPEILLMEELL